MNPKSRPEAAQPLDEVAEELVKIAQRSRQLAQDGHIVELHALLEDVRTRADGAAGPELLLLEVGEAFLRAIARSDLGRTELALRRFVVEHPEASEKFISALLERRRLLRSEVEELASEVRASVQALIDVGALRELDDGAALDLRPSMRGIARDLISPPAFRLWRRVQQLRTRVVREGIRGDAAAHLLAAELGVTLPEARQHLAGHPTATRYPLRRPTSAAAAEPPEHAALTGGGESKRTSAATLSTAESSSSTQHSPARTATTSASTHGQPTHGAPPRPSMRLDA